MTAKDINDALNTWFWRYDYRLNNSFIFDWESDFLCMSSSNYWVEIEVKISRQDFFRDFEKDKHKLFKLVRAGRTHMVKDWGKQAGDKICSYTAPVIHSDYGNESRRDCWAYRHIKGKWGYVVNDWGRTYVYQQQVDVFAPATRIHIEDLKDRRLPHQFYFAVPAGLVDVDEIPDYAGFIEIVDGGVSIVRRAPYLHKRKMDLTRQLLQKYYNLWRFNFPGDKYEAMIKAKLF